MDNGSALSAMLSLVAQIVKHYGHGRCRALYDKMCVALVLFLNNFYKIYENTLEYCEHLTAATLLLVTVAIIFTPVILMLTPEDAKNSDRPFIAIVVLVSGVAGGLLIVIAFVFFCKNCFKKKAPLTTCQSPSAKRRPCNIGDPSSQTKGDQKLLVGSVGSSPVPADLEAYLQQPQSENNNTELAPDYSQFVDVHKTNYLCRQMTNGSDEMQLIVETNEVNPVDDKAKNTYDSAFALCPPKNMEHPMTSGKNMLAVPERQRAHSTSHRDDNSNTLNISKEELRRRSFDDRLRPGTGRKLPRALTQDTAYHANQYDMKYVGADGPAHCKPVLQKQSHSVQQRVTPDHWPPPVIDRPMSPRSALASLPRSHQIVIEKTSPPLPRKQISAPLPHPSMDLMAPGNDGGKQMYCQGHRNSMSWDVQVSDRANDRRWMYAREPRMAYSFASSETEPRKFAPVRQSSARSPEHSDVSMPSSGAAEYDALNKFYRQVQAVFTKNYAISTTSSSSDSTAGQQQRLVVAAPPLLTSRQVKSLETDHYGSLGVTVPLNRQAHSFDDRVSCAACQNDAMQRLPHVALPQAPGPSYSQTRTTSPGLRRQRPLEEPEIYQLEDAATEQIKGECVRLWALRNTLEDPNDEVDDGPEEVQVVPVLSIDEPSGLSSEGTPYTTSFESNTEPTNVDEYLKQHRPSGPFLEPPKLSLEAKRQKYKNLFARRQQQLQQTGGSFDTSVEKSFESYCTYSSESSHLEMFPTSFESNTGEQTDSTVDSAGRKSLAELKADSGYKSQSTEVTTQTPGRSFENPAELPQPSAPLPQPNRRPYEQSLDKRRVEAFFEAQDETDSKSDPGVSGESFDDPGVHSQLPPLPPGRLPALPINPHLVRMRRSYENPSTGFYKMPLSRDYSIDTKTDNIFREFLKFDPKLESSSRRGPRYNYSVEGEGRARLPRLQAADSIEEEHLSPSGAVSLPPVPVYGRQHSIPVIRLPEEQDVSS